MVRTISAGSAVIAALALSACAGSDSADQMAEARGDAGRIATDQEVRLLASLTPAAGAGRIEDEQVLPPEGTGERIDFRTDLSREEREMIYSVLPDEVELGGGIAAAPMYLANPDLNGDGVDDAIVFVKAGPYCGSGDVCNFWVFERTATGLVQINGDDDDAARSLSLLPTSTGGYRDIRIHGFCGGEECDFLLTWRGDAYHWINDPTPRPPESD